MSASWTKLDCVQTAVPRFHHVWNWNCLGESAARRPRPHVQRHLSGELRAQHARHLLTLPVSTPRNDAPVYPCAHTQVRASRPPPDRHPSSTTLRVDPFPSLSRRTYSIMAATPQKPAAAPVRRKASRHRGEGQWAAGHFTPLNANEQAKKDDDGLNVRTRIETIYSKRGFDSIDPGDLRGRMRWWGLYTQRKPGIDGGKTAILEPEELDDKYFMLRVRIDCGALTTEQLRALGEISQTYARDTADVTDRQNIQYHWIEIESMPAIWQRLESLGMITTEACGDTPRVILGSPVAGIAADDEIDPQPAIDAILERYIGSKEFSNLPRKFKTAISWQQDVAHEVHDISFIGAVHPEHGPGFYLWVGGGLSTNPKIAQRLGVWVPLDEVPDVWEGVISIFRDYGSRRLRHRARIKFLVADWGVEKFRQVLQDEYLHRTLIDGPAPATPERPIDHVGVHKQRDGLNYVGLAPASGRVSGTPLVGVADHLG